MQEDLPAMIRIWNEVVEEGIAFPQEDLLDAESVNQLVKSLKVTHIINLAAVSSVGLSWKIPQKTMDVNVTSSTIII